MKSNIILQGYMIVPDADLALVKEELIIHQELTRLEEGCIVFEVTQDSQNANKFFVYEAFIDQDAFDHHQRRIKHSNWGKVAVNIQRHYTISNTSHDLQKS